MYMPSHFEDLPLLPNIQAAITQQITQHPNYMIILCNDFNRDIAILGRYHSNAHTLPQEQDFVWNTLIHSLNATYIPTTTTYTRQGGKNYTHTSLIDGFYIKAPNHHLFSYTTNTELPLNSSHMLVHLRISQNLLIAKTNLLPPLQTP
jgi:hypothetical protein